jgi:cation/acetate symporter
VILVTLDVCQRTTREGAIAGMVTGISFTAAYIVWFRFVHPEAGADSWLFGISPEGIGAVGMALNFAIAILVSRFTPPPPQHVQEMIEEIRLPRAAPDLGEMAKREMEEEIARSR